MIWELPCGRSCLSTVKRHPHQIIKLTWIKDSTSKQLLSVRNLRKMVVLSTLASGTRKM